MSIVDLPGVCVAVRCYDVAAQLEALALPRRWIIELWSSSTGHGRLPAALAVDMQTTTHPWSMSAGAFCRLNFRPYWSACDSEPGAVWGVLSDLVWRSRSAVTDAKPNTHLPVSVNDQIIVTSTMTSFSRQLIDWSAFYWARCCCRSHPCWMLIQNRTRLSPSRSCPSSWQCLSRDCETRELGFASVAACVKDSSIAPKPDNPVDWGWVNLAHPLLAKSRQWLTCWNSKLETVKTISSPRKINAILLNIKINLTKSVSMCWCKLATNWQNFREIYVILQEVLAGLLFWLTLYMAAMDACGSDCAVCSRWSVVERGGDTRLCWTAHRIMTASSAERMLIAVDGINMEIVAVAAVAEALCVIISGVYWPDGVGGVRWTHHWRISLFLYISLSPSMYVCVRVCWSILHSTHNNKQTMDCDPQLVFGWNCPGNFREIPWGRKRPKGVCRGGNFFEGAGGNF